MPPEAWLTLAISVLIGMSAWALLTLMSVRNTLTSIDTWRTQHELLDNERHMHLDKSLTSIDRRLELELDKTNKLASSAIGENKTDIAQVKLALERHVREERHHNP